MTLPQTGSFLASLTQPDRVGLLTERVKNLPVPEFVCLLDFLTAEFQQFLSAFDLVNNESLESILEQILDAIAFKIGQILAAENTTIFLVDRDREHLWARPDHQTADPTNERRIPLNAGITGRVAVTGEVMNIPDARQHPFFLAEVDGQAHCDTRNLLCVPVDNADGQIVAVVRLLNKTGEAAFNATDELRFQEFAAAIGIILESCQSFYAAARNQRGAAALLKATTCLAQSLDLDRTLQAVMDEARDLLKAERSYLFLRDRDTGNLWAKLTQPDGSTGKTIQLSADRGIAGYVASTGHPLNVTNVVEDPRFDPEVDRQMGARTRNLLCMPVFNSEGELIGVSQLVNRKQGSFSASDEAFMRAFNIQAGIAIENARLFEDVRQEQQYQRDILQSLTNAVISTDMQGRIVTINEAAMELLGCPVQAHTLGSPTLLWEQYLLDRPVWEVIPLERLQMRLQDSLHTGARHYVPEQVLTIGLYDPAAIAPPAPADPASLDPAPSEDLAPDRPGAHPTVANPAAAPAPKDVVREGKRLAPLEPDPITLPPPTVTPLSSLPTVARPHPDPRPSEVPPPHPSPRPVSTPPAILGDRADAPSGVVPTRSPWVLPMLAVPRAGQNPPHLPASRSPTQSPEHPPQTARERSPLVALNGQVPPACSIDVPPNAIRCLERNINVSIAPLTNHDGKVRGGLVVLEDISREKRMKTTLYRYMSPGVADRVMALGEDTLMVGERKNVTILFSDIRGYTSLTENLGAAEVVSLLNQYFETMVEAVFELGGTLDKFIGDALMAVFGAPLPLPEDHAWLAIQAALEMRDRLRVFNQRRIMAHQPQIRVGMGIASGDVVAGNIGSQRRMDYTTIGDAVNVSARLENLTKQYFCDIILSEVTYERCRDRVWARELDRVRVKGKQQAISIYELLGYRSDPLSPPDEAFLDNFHRGREAYQKRQFQRAIVHFAAAQRIRPQDQAVKLHINRSVSYLDCPPPDFWDGTFSAPMQ